MTVEDFKIAVASASPPAVDPLLQALWHDAKGDWDRAHAIAQEVDGERGAWVHAYLHRKEGDPGNAAYWYQRAKQRGATDALDAEWERIVSELLRSSS